VHSGKIFAEVIAKTLVHLAKGTRNSKVHKTTNRINPNKSIPKYNIIKFLKTKGKTVL
jgi:hypothetical protein